MAISNGFDTSLVMPKLIGRNKWRSLGSASTSGRNFEQFHPLCTLANLRAVQEMPNITDAAFAVFIADLEQGVIMQLLNGLFDKPQMIDNTLIFDRKLRNDNVYGNNGKFCGYRIYVANGDYAVQPTRASFLFNGAVSFPLYLFHDMLDTPLYTTVVTTVANNEVYVDLDNWILKYQQTQSQGGTFYIGYFQNDLGNVHALDQFITQWNGASAFGITGFETPATGSTTFIRRSIPYTLTTYGMNIELQSYHDYTNRIIKNVSMFDEAIGLMMACVVLSYESYSTRSNGAERITKELAAQIYNEINNAGFTTESNPYVAGLKKRIEREMKKLNENFFCKPTVITTIPQCR